MPAHVEVEAAVSEARLVGNVYTRKPVRRGRLHGQQLGEGLHPVESAGVIVAVYRHQVFADFEAVPFRDGFFDRRARRAVAVAEDGSPFQKLVGLGHGFEFRIVDEEVIAAVDLAGTGLACRDGNRE